jgi:hypothetical protein
MILESSKASGNRDRERDEGLNQTGRDKTLAKQFASH